MSCGGAGRTAGLVCDACSVLRGRDSGLAAAGTRPPRLQLGRDAVAAAPAHRGDGGEAGREGGAEAKGPGAAHAEAGEVDAVGVHPVRGGMSGRRRQASFGSRLGLSGAAGSRSRVGNGAPPRLWAAQMSSTICARRSCEFLPLQPRSVTGAATMMPSTRGSESTARPGGVYRTGQGRLQLPVVRSNPGRRPAGAEGGGGACWAGLQRPASSVVGPVWHVHRAQSGRGGSRGRTPWVRARLPRPVEEDEQRQEPLDGARGDSQEVREPLRCGVRGDGARGRVVRSHGVFTRPLRDGV